MSERLIHAAFDCAHERQSQAGVTRYSVELRAALRLTPGIEVIAIGAGDALQRGTARKKLVTLKQDLWWYPIAARRSAAGAGADVYHCPSPRAPLRHGKPPLVVTIHDLTSLRHPQTLSRWSRIYERATLRHVVRAADRIISVSRDTADDIQTMLGAKADKIRVIHEGVKDIFFASDHVAPGDRVPYVLFVGTPQPRKNLGRLSQAVDQLRRRGEKLRLIVAGSDGWGTEQLVPGHVDYTGRIDDLTLRSLYRNAACVALVSLHEGFGLPAIEAMAAGAPVVASTGGALPEVVGDAAILVDPYNVDSIADGISKALSSRIELSRRGRERAALFTWRLAAERTLEVYRELV